MLSRYILKSSHLRFLTHLSSKTHFPQPNPITKPPSFPLPNPHFFPKSPHFYSTNNGNNNKTPPDIWNFSSDPTPDSLFPKESIPPNSKPEKMDSWVGRDEDEKGDDILRRGGGGGDGWNVGEEPKPWDLGVGVGEEVKVEKEMFEGGELEADDEVEEVDLVMENDEENKKLEVEEKGLVAVLKGPDRAFGDLIAASGITDEMLDSLIALKDLSSIQGLPPLTEIEDMRYENNTKRSSRADIERQKQEEVARARVREVDSKGRAYGTGKRKCSIARVWIQPGEGKFVVNDKEFDVYFPMLDHRAALLRPFTETKTLGIWDVNCTVKGGGVSGQVGAIRLGVSRALQCWDPTLRPPLKEAGFLTRDSRIVERKKPGRAKARKSFQWVKR